VDAAFGIPWGGSIGPYAQQCHWHSTQFPIHLFQFLDWKEEAWVQKQVAAKLAERTLDIRRRFYMDFGFMRASSLDYKRPNKGTDRVIASWDGYSSYLLVVDEAS
jgi:hypothetical protein